VEARTWPFASLTPTGAGGRHWRLVRRCWSRPLPPGTLRSAVAQ
jgi:hypothetical protein